MTTGVMIVPPFNEISIPLIKYGTQHSNEVISNYKLGIPHRFLKIGEANKVWGSTDIIVEPKQVKMNISDPIIKQIALMIEIAQRSDDWLLVYKDIRDLNMLQLLVALSLKKPVHVIVGDKPIKDADVIKMVQSSDQEVLRRQYEQLMNPTVDVKVYNEDELIRTPNGAKLRQYQQQMVDFVIEQKRAGLFVDMGLGKTLATLATINKLVETNKIDKTKPILIIAPITVALDTWSREAEKWGYDFDVEINIQLTPKKREDLFERISKPLEKVTIVTTNPQQLPSIEAYFKDKPKPFSMFVIDELSMFKSATAKRFKQMLEVGKNIEYAIGLTGTPAPNNLLDVWSQLMIIDPKNKRYFGSNFFYYRDTFFEPDVIARDGTVYKWKLKPNAEYDIYNKMKHSVISMQSKGLVDLPDIIYDNRYVKLPSKAQKIYKDMDTKIRRHLAAQDNSYHVEYTTEEGDEFAFANIGVLTSKLAQLSSGAIYDNILSTDEEKAKQQKQAKKEGRVPFTEFHDVKLQALKEIVETATSPILVFFYFKSELERLGKYIEYEHLDPHRPDFQDVIRRWNKGEIPVLVAHPASAGHGLNLQDGGHTIVWLTTTWSNEQYRQANKRLHRSGQENTVTVIHIVAEGTIDEEIIDRLDIKEDSQSRLMEELDVAIRPEET